MAMATQVMGTHHGHQGSLLHDAVECLRARRPTLHLRTEQVSSGDVGEVVLGYDLVTLRPLPTAGPS